VKKYLVRIGSMLAALTLVVAESGAGLTSWISWYQPKVPDHLIRD
jgi:cyclic lactone autoinducer peptide